MVVSQRPPEENPFKGDTVTPLSPDAHTSTSTQGTSPVRISDDTATHISADRANKSSTLTRTIPEEGTMSFTLAACAEMVFTDQPLIDRIARIAERGLKVEIWGWQDKDLDAIAASDAEIVSMTGYIDGDLTTEQGIQRLLTTAGQSLEAAALLGCPRLNVHGTGLGEGGTPSLPTPIPPPPTGCRRATPSHASPNSGRQPDGPSPWRTSARLSTTPDARSPRPRTPAPSSPPSTPRRCA